MILVLFTIKFLSRNVHRGFICGDPSLSLSRKPDTIRNWMLLIWGTSPILIVRQLISINLFSIDNSFRFKLLISEIFFNFEEFDNIKLCLKRSWRNTAYLSHRYLLNMALKYILMVTAKFFTGSHRPHFFETCKPDTMLNCTLGTFVDDYECTNTEARKIQVIDASMSFFSGHASTCVFSCLFIVWYLQKRLKFQSPFILPFAQITLICLSYYGSISRVFDHRHHWWDVLAGAIVGILTTYHTVDLINPFY